MKRILAPGAALTLTTAALTVLPGCDGQGADAAPAGKVKVAGVEVRKDEALHDALPDEIKESGTVRVATDVPYPPFEMYAKEGSTELTGLDHDL
jgi:polar amino acid transport system substrate-binding protein